MNTEDSIERLQKQHYDEFAAHKTRRDVLPSSRVPRKAITLRSVEPVIKARGGLGVVLDIGCGISATAVYLDRIFERYIGIDLSEGMINIGREFTKDIDNVELHVANAKEIPVEEYVADVVFMDGALHHMTDIPTVMRSIQKHAKPGAWFVAREPQRGNPLIQLLRKIRMNIDPSYSRDQVFFTESELIKIMENSGLEDIRVEYQGFLIPPMAQVVLSPQWLFSPLANALVLLEKVVEKVMIGPLKKLSWNVSVYGKFPGL